MSPGGSVYEDLRQDREDRSHVTLLDRVLGLKLFRTLFPHSPAESIFATHASAENNEQYAGRLSPFDYDQADPKVSPLLWTESFIVNCVWDDHYSSTVLGKNGRPSMSVIVINLLDYLRDPYSPGTTVTLQLPTFIYSVLHGFAAGQKACSIMNGASLDWAAKGYLADMFNLVTCVHYVGRKEPGSKVIQQTDIMGKDWYERDGPWKWSERHLFPGSNSLRLPKLAYDQLGIMPLDALNAEFICSGPFRLTFTTLLAEHLIFNQNRLTVMSWNFNVLCEILKPLEEHVLGKYLEVRRHS